MQARAAGVRRVSSITGTPPSTRASATGTACDDVVQHDDGDDRHAVDQELSSVIGSSTNPWVGNTLAPWSAGPTLLRNACEQLAAGAEDERVVTLDGVARLEVEGRDVQLEHAGVGVERDQVAVLHAGERAADGGLGRQVDRRRAPCRTRRTCGRR